MNANGSPWLLALVNLVWLAAVGGLLVWWIRRGRRADRTLDPAFQELPQATGTVVDRTYQYRRVNSRNLYRITYLVRTDDGQQFQGWEDKYLAWTVKSRFDVGAVHRVAYRPGADAEVRAVP